MKQDVLAELAALPGVADAISPARAAVDELLWDRRTRKVAAELARWSALRGAWASAAMDGADLPFDAVLSGVIEDSPLGHRQARAVALAVESPRLVEVYARSPMQAWARMNTVLAAGLVPPDAVGRPRRDADPDDPLRIGSPVSGGVLSERLAALSDTILSPTQAPAIVVSGVVHAELAVLRPFRFASGQVARATVRVSLAARGLDPDLLTVPESGLLTLGRNSYVRALRQYAAGTPEGVAAWLRWFSDAVRIGAEQSRLQVVVLG